MEKGQNNLVLPPEFSGPPQLILFTRYGDPREPGWENKWIINWKVQQLHPWFPTEGIRIHKHFWPILRDAFLELESVGLHKEIKSCHTCHEVGNLHKSAVLSVHSWGGGIDLNEKDNPPDSPGNWSPEFIHIMTKHGISCGINWTVIKHPCHFAMVDGE